MALFGRLRCHYCGNRSAYSRGTTEFKCLSCEAYNFYDQRGNVVDTPFNYSGSPPSSNKSDPGRHAAYSRDHNAPISQTFCDTCIKNQQLYNECMSNYLPDEDDPQYRQYELRLPEYQKELERRYPLVCTRCAPVAQTSIHDADLFSQTSTLARTMRRSRGQGFQRHHGKGMLDSPTRGAIRSLLNILDIAIYSSLLIQVVWHAYGAVCIHTTGSLPMVSEADLNATANMTLGQCAMQMLAFRFTPYCFNFTTDLVARALSASIILIWFNPAWKYYWDDTVAVEVTYGETQWYSMQLVILVVRVAAWLSLRGVAYNPAYNVERMKAFHAFVAVFLLFTHWLSRQGFGYRKKTVNTKIMPLPNERDVLGRDAGPAERRPKPQASSMNPFRLFQRDEQPFQIRNLATGSLFEHAGSAYGHPSPPASQSPSSDRDDDAMDFDWSQPTPANSQIVWPASQGSFGAPRPNNDTDHVSQAPGWSAVRNETFRIDNSLRSEAEVAQQNQYRQNQMLRSSPFRGTLPPAPMSMERRLRNPPVNRADFRNASPTIQPNLMSKLREGIEEASTFRVQQGRRKPVSRDSLRRPDPDLDGSQYDPEEAAQSKHPRAESASREYEIKPGKWTLQQDLDAQATGLEDLFGGKAFSIADEPGNKDKNGSILNGNNTLSRLKYTILAVFVGFIAMSWFWLPARRAVAIYLLKKLVIFEHWLFLDHDIAPLDQ